MGTGSPSVSRSQAAFPSERTTVRDPGLELAQGIVHLLRQSKNKLQCVADAVRVVNGVEGR